MKKYFIAIAIIVVLYAGWALLNRTHVFPGPAISDSQTLANAIKERRSGVQVMGEGVVTKILPDDIDGSRHQRFILSLASGQTLLVSHNIDLAPRLTSLKPGDSVAFNGVFEWNSKGGLIHWTHHDPSGQHQAGWLKHKGQTFK